MYMYIEQSHCVFFYSTLV